MGMSLARLVLEGHRRAGEPPWTNTRGEETWRVRVDHVVVGAERGALSLAAFHRLSLPRIRAELALASPDRVGGSPASASEQRWFHAARRWGALESRPGAGRCDRIYAERFGSPGKLALFAADEAPSSGALGVLAFSSGALEAASALASAVFELPAPRSVAVRVHGSFASRVSGQDLVLALSPRRASVPFSPAVVELCGPGMPALSMADRFTVAGQAAALRSTAVLLPSDETTRRFLKAQGRETDWKRLEADQDADWDELFEVDLDTLEPRIAPRVEPEAARLARHGAGMPVARVVVGGRASAADWGKLAGMMRGRTVDPATELLVLSGSRQVLDTAERAGWVETLRTAGARVLEGGGWPGAGTRSRGPRAGLCFGVGAEECGEGGFEWYLASPESCAAAALTGRITDPREIDVDPGEAEEPGRYAIDEASMLRPFDPGAELREPEASSFPPGRPVRGVLRGAVLARLRDHAVTDDIVPWGARMLPHATEISALSEHALEATEPGFAGRALSQRGGLLVAGSGLGAGERGEIAALVLAALGVRGVLARGFDAEFHGHLVHAGILPLRLAHEADLRAIEPGDELEIPGLPEALAPGKPLVVRNLTRGSQYTPQHDLAPRDIAILEAGGLLAFHREAVEAQAPA